MELEKYLAYAMTDERSVTVTFDEVEGRVTITETFDPETLNPPERQRAGWQSILNNFKTYVEAQ